MEEEIPFTAGHENHAYDILSCILRVNRSEQAEHGHYCFSIDVIPHQFKSGGKRYYDEFISYLMTQCITIKDSEVLYGMDNGGIETINVTVPVSDADRMLAIVSDDGIQDLLKRA